MIESAPARWGCHARNQPAYSLKPAKDGCIRHPELNYILIALCGVRDCSRPAKEQHDAMIRVKNVAKNDRGNGTALAD
jgi:hypothetical protein